MSKSSSKSGSDDPSRDLKVSTSSLDPEEGLRLMDAFTKIDDENVRAALLRIAETLARLCNQKYDNDN